MDSAAHAQRRARLLEITKPGVVVVFAAPVALRNHDVEHDYRQHSDLYYLSGFDEPESVLVLASEAEHRYTLFVRPRDPEAERWDGARAGCEGAVERYGADAAYPIAELGSRLPGLLEGHQRLFFDIGACRTHDDQLLAALRVARQRGRRGKRYPTQISDLGDTLHELRRIKDSLEVTRLVAALAITGEAHVECMRRARAGMYEYELEAILSGVFRRRGAQRPAYSSIVGSGHNATVLHYRRNDRQLEASDLVLIDAGCELDYYASDVTRTFPVSGRFSPEQRAVYELVLGAQQAAIDATLPGATFEDVHQAALRVVAQGLLDLRLVDGSLDAVLERETYKPYFMHRTSHYMGMDVHDVGTLFADGAHRPLVPGVVLTVEPGVYVAADAEAAPEGLRGIGVRIEDDVLVTEDGARVLSAAIPKTVADVELACSG